MASVLSYGGRGSGDSAELGVRPSPIEPSPSELQCRSAHLISGWVGGSAIDGDGRC